MRSLEPFSQASENNKQAILDVLTDVFAQRRNVLEVGSGTGQHATFFAGKLKHLMWQPSDRKANLAGIMRWCEAYPCESLCQPIELDVTQELWPEGYDAVFSANTAHIMPWGVAQQMIRKVALSLPISGRFALYGPFNYDQQFTSESNRDFDAYLKSSNPLQGIRHFEEVNALARDVGLSLMDDYAMPANNRLLIWEKVEL